MRSALMAGGACAPSATATDNRSRTMGALRSVPWRSRGRHGSPDAEPLTEHGKVEDRDEHDDDQSHAGCMNPRLRRHGMKAIASSPVRRLNAGPVSAMIAVSCRSGAGECVTPNGYRTFDWPRARPATTCDASCRSTTTGWCAIFFSLGEGDLRITDVDKTTVDGQPATLMTLTNVGITQNGSLGCAELDREFL